MTGEHQIPITQKDVKFASSENQIKAVEVQKPEPLDRSADQKNVDLEKEIQLHACIIQKQAELVDRMLGLMENFVKKIDNISSSVGESDEKPTKN